MDTPQQPSTQAESNVITPKSLAVLMNFGHIFYGQGRWNDARDVFEAALLIDSSNPYAHAILGSIHQQLNQFENAVDSYSRALHLYSKDINSLINRGECLLHLGRLTEAAADFHAGIALDREEKSPAANRARFLAAVTLEALKLAEEGGEEAVLEAKRRLDEQLTKSR